MQLEVIQQKEVRFYEDDLTAVRAADGHVYVTIRQMCLALGLDSQAQRRRMMRHTIIADGVKVVANLATTFGDRDAYVLRVDLVPLWLSGIRTAAVNDDARPKLERFQREAAKVLWEAFQEGRLTADPDFDALLATAANSETVQAYQIAQAVMKLARQQILIEARLSGRLDVHENKLADHDNRLETIETTLTDSGRNVTPDQASQISQAVKAIALAVSRKSGRNEFGAVYGELYRREGVTSYKLIPAYRFERVMGWLTDWYQELTGQGTLPF
jgi:hypothetical protein